MNNSRVLLVLIDAVLAFLALVFRLFSIQVVKSDELSYFAKRQHTNSEIVKADRGFIYDRSEVLLVYNRNDYSFFADLRMLPASEKEKLAKKFSVITRKSKNHYLKLLKGNGKTICLEKKLSFEKSVELFDYKNPAFFYVEEPVSVFHYGSLGSHILGYVDADYRGVNGIQKSFDEILSGRDGSRLVERNALGDIISISEEQTISPDPGDDLYLTMDKRIQAIVEDDLKAALNETSAESATCIIMNPNNGEILALANVADYDPNNYWTHSDFERKNRAITDTYEPGSTLKAFTISALLEEKACRENEIVNVENGIYKYRNNYIRDTHKFQTLSVRGIIEESSNIGIAKLVQRISDEKFYEHIRAYGFGTYTSIALPGEVTGNLRELDKWSKLTKTYMSFGYGLSVTPLQMTNAFCALVNGGILYKPQIIKKQVDKNGNVVNEISPIAVRRVISEKTSERVRNLLLGAVEKGTGKLAKIDSVLIGGKTGTSKITVNGKYSNDKYSSTFIGFYPANKPEIVCYVLITKPKGKYYGGMVAAPVFKRINEKILALGKRNWNENYPYEEMKTVKNDTSPNKENYSFINQNEKNINRTENVFVSTSSQNVMPDLKGKTIKEALLIMNEMGIQCSISGSGVVVNQSIAPGSVIKGRKSCRITCLQIITEGASIY
jgi:cell division protein FtsI (penicillin-binding protein 3)